MSDYNIKEAFERIENELIDSMMRNFSRHRAEETKEGYNWTQWQAEQLKSLEEYRKHNAKKFGKRFKTINSKVEEMIRTAKADGNASQEAEILEAVKDGFKAPKKPSEHSTAEFFKVNDRKLDALIKSTTDDLKRAETAVLRMSNDKYRKAIFNAQVAMNTGAVTYEKAVDIACKDMLNAGLNCVEYKNGARHTLSDYADMAVKTANKRAYLRGEGEKRAEWGVSLVVVNSRQGGCPDCAKYIGKVFIDDVYSNGKKSDGNYPLLSTAIKNGLFHPRCKDSTSTYYEEITTLEPVTPEEEAEMDRRERLEEKQQYAERQAQRFDRRAEYSLDDDNKRIAQKRADEWHDKAKKAKKKSKKIDTGTSQKSDVQKKTVEKAENNDIIKETKQLSLSNVEEFENWQNDYYELNKDVSFSRDDNPSIYRYTGGDYDIVNALERGGEFLEKVKKRYGEKYVSSLNGVGDEISKELSKFKLNEPLKLKRSVGNVDFITNATSSVEDMRKMIGKKFTEKGFTSTTLCSDTQLAFGGIDKPTRTTLEIIAPKETKGAYLYKISDSPAEFEFLIDKNTTYEVVDAGEREITVKDYKGNYEKKTERFMTLKVVEQ
nr:phage minor capsid protein [uncultured Ruminococcus sp.]